MSNYSYRFNREFILPAHRYTFETNHEVRLDALRKLVTAELDALDYYWIIYQRTHQKPFKGHFREVSIVINIDGRSTGELFYGTTVLDNGEVEWYADLSRSKFQSLHLERLDIYSYDNDRLSTLLVQEWNAQQYGKRTATRAASI